MAGRSPQLPASEKKVETIVRAINQLAQGRGDNRGTVTLRASQTTTTVENQFVGENSSVILFPRSASAATAFGAGVVYVSSKTNGAFVITHDSNAATDRIFDFIFVG
jgi:hypothetical protein